MTLSRYRVSGIVIQSPFALPELKRTQAKPDVALRMGAVGRAPAQAKRVESWLQAGETDAHLYWRDVGTFVVRNGREVVVEAAAAVDPAVIRLFVLGPVLAVLLRQRGLLVLHGAAVEVDGGAVLILGASGWGKSTFAAALHRHGHGLISDDAAAIDTRTARPVVVSGVPLLKLWPDAVAALGDSPDSLPRLRPNVDKRARRAASGGTEPVPLERIYILAPGREQMIERLRPREALLELLRHSYGARTLQSLRTREHFRQCAKVVNEVPIARLAVPRSLARLAEVADLVEQDGA